MTLNAPTGRTQTLTAAITALGMAAAVGTALGFQHFGGYIPCKLCLEQRVPYYVGIPVAVLALTASVLKLPPIVTRLLLAVGGAMMLWTMALGVYHSGVEWGWWLGPTDCGAVAAPAGSAGGVLDQLNTVIPPSCDKAAGRFLGLSFAGWNVVASLILALIAFRGAFSGGKSLS
ncbi:disulfide bond formation protein DsbB [Mesorhizobium sp. J18]|uniref:disulfide bond formation protein B n=1 Tax=Mesorhizobium sp. J18 TaxID=935263 RepID=UPI00119A673B|nr:disulfide bond formation protein B [Mesorhizobium sp. J18]TWG90375.1 disulfide bond formation protein DsbB [Mesorhizobium sp. J18]